VQVRDAQAVHWQTHFTAGGFFQIPLFAVTNLVAFALRWFPKFAAAAPCVHALSFLFLLDWPCEFRRKMLEREFAWARLRGLHLVGLVVGCLVAVNLALAGWGVYALVLPGLLVTLPFIYDLFVAARWRPDWSWSWKDYQPAWQFGWTRVASGLAVRGRQLVEGTAVVALLGFGELGLLNGAVGIAQMTCNLFTEQLLNSIYPVLTRVNPEPANIARVNGLLLRFVAWAIIPTAVLASALAGPLLLTLYGSKWTATIALLPWAMALGLFNAFNNVASTLLLAQERLRWCLQADLGLLVGVTLALGLALPQGLRFYLGVAAAVQLAVFIFMLVGLLRTGGLRWREICSAFLPAGCAAAVGLTLCEMVARVTRVELTHLPVAVAYGAGFTTVCVVVWRLGFTAQLTELLAYAPKGKFLRRALWLAE
jgi:PST family polysaccharide transporter